MSEVSGDHAKTRTTESKARWAPLARLVFGLLLAGLVNTAVGCESTPQSPIERAEFGVLFGGQIQERTEIPFELDATKQALGFVVKLQRPLASPAALHWEVSKPAPAAPGRLADPLNRRVELFEATISAGQQQIQKTVNLEPGDGLGLWNIRVTLGDHIALDRPFMVFDPATRTTKVRKQGPIDAGL